jgi:hypothetical protein
MGAAQRPKQIAVSRRNKKSEKKRIPWPFHSSYPGLFERLLPLLLPCHLEAKTKLGL